MASTYYQIGSKGDEVKDLQKQINAANAGVQGYVPLVEDGIYGKLTAGAVSDYQKANNLTVDGIAGAQTLGSLYKPATTTQPTQPIMQPITQPVQPIQQPVQQPVQPVVPEYTNPYAAQEQQALADYQAWASQPYVAQYAPEIESLVKNILSRQFDYDPKNDAQFQAASRELTRNVLESMNARGILNSTVTENQVQQGVSDLLPQYQQIARKQFMDEGQQLMSQVDMLTGLDNTAYGRYQDQGKQLANALDVVIQMDDSQYKKWSDAYERRYQAQQDQVKATESKLEADRQKVKDAWDRTSEVGYVDNPSSITLGVTAGTLSKEAREAKQNYENDLKLKEAELKKQKEMAAYQYNLSKKLAALKGDSSASAETLGTKAQVDQYYALRDIYFGGGSGKYAGKPLDAYNWLTSHSKDNIGLVGQKLYSKLLTELTEAMKTQKSYGSMGEMKPGDYKTDPDFAKNVAYIVANPDTALNDIMANSEQLIKDYGIDGYNELIRKATPKE